MKIQICGPGCSSCKKTFAVVQDAITEAGVTAEVEKVEDFAAMAKLGVMSTPAVVIDGVIKCVGAVPSKKQVLAWLT